MLNFLRAGPQCVEAKEETGLTWLDVKPVNKQVRYCLKCQNKSHSISLYIVKNIFHQNIHILLNLFSSNFSITGSIEPCFVR